MKLPPRPHILGIDDAPFRKDQEAEVPIVGVIMEGATLVEGVVMTSFPVDGADATGFLGDWIEDLRWYPALHAVVLGGITLAGLGIVDLHRLAHRLALPIIAATRRDTTDSTLPDALRAAGLGDRLAIVERYPPARRVRDGLYIAWAGAEFEEAAEIVHATLNKAKLPEPLRVAHLIGAALVTGASRGRA